MRLIETMITTVSIDECDVVSDDDDYSSKAV